MLDVDKNIQEKQWNVGVIRKQISKNIYTQLEMAIYKDFIQSFNLLNKFNVSTIRIIKKHSVVDNNRQLLRNESQMSEI